MINSKKLNCEKFATKQNKEKAILNFKIKVLDF